MRITAFTFALATTAFAFGCSRASHTDEPAAAPVVNTGAGATPATDATPPTTPGAHTQAAAIGKVGNDPGQVGDGTKLVPKPGHQLAEFAAGCFWGVEDAFRKIHGVTATAVGFTGGHTDNPSYDAVCEHNTGHAETVLVEFDPTNISYEKLLKVFFAIHDPTQLDAQGPDEGDQYRSEVFTFDDAQAAAVKSAIAALQPDTKGKIVTKVEPARRFWKAEGYHQQYSERTGHHGCPIGKIPAGI